VKKLLVAVVLLVLLLTGSWAQGVDRAELIRDMSGFYGPADYATSALLHYHGNFSDGTFDLARTAVAAQYCGVQVVVMTEHLDCINIPRERFTDYLAHSFISNFTGPVINAAYRPLIGAAPKESGDSNYIQACRAMSEASGVLLVPGIEVTLGGFSDRVYDPDGSGNYVHLLGIGLATPRLNNDLRNYLGVRLEPYKDGEKTLRLDDAQAQVARMMHDAGLAVVVAHPYLRDKANPGHMYTVYKNKFDDIDGVEFFNSTTDEMSMEAMGIIKRDLLMPPFKDLAPTAGADFHGLFLTEAKRWYQITILSLSGPVTCRADRYEAECAMVAEAIRDPRLTVTALSENCLMSDDSLVDIWQGPKLLVRGQNEKGEPRIAPGQMDFDRAVYIHTTDKAMIRCLPSQMVENLELMDNEPASHREKRLGPFMMGIDRREVSMNAGDLSLDKLLTLGLGKESPPAAPRRSGVYTGGAIIHTVPLGGNNYFGPPRR